MSDSADMGSIAALVIAVGTSGVAAAVARTISTWLATRPSLRVQQHSDLEVEFMRQDGSTLRVSGERISDPEEFMRTRR